MSFGEIDMACPVNWGHPLNIGRVAWWIQPASIGMGRRLWDVCGSMPLRVFGTAKISPSDGHFAAATLNGGGFPRTTEYLISDVTTRWPHRGLTVCATVYFVDGGRPRGIAAMTQYVGWQFAVDSSGVLQLQRAGLDAVAGGAVALDTFRKYRVGVSHQIGSASNNIRFFVNGKPDAVATSTKTYGTVQSAIIAGADGYTGSLLNGWISNITMYNRHLSDHEIAWDSELSERQYLGRDSPLNRVTGRTYYLPLSATPSVFAPAFGPGWGFAA